MTTIIGIIIASSTSTTSFARSAPPALPAAQRLLAT
jgi:hypothetical protein